MKFSLSLFFASLELEAQCLVVEGLISHPASTELRNEKEIIRDLMINLVFELAGFCLEISGRSI